MKMEFNNLGKTATVTLTSTIFEFKKHNRLAEKVVAAYAPIKMARSGSFIMKTVITGSPLDAWLIKKSLDREIEG